MKAKDNPKANSMLKKDDMIVVAGAGGFIAGALVKYFRDQGFKRIRAVDKKPLSKVSACSRRRISVFRPQLRRQLQTDMRRCGRGV